MSFASSLLLGFVQGVTEFLPISSSGHLLVFRHLLGLQDIPILFDILLHLSTLGVVALVFRRRIAGLFVSLARLARVPAAAPVGEEDRENLRLVLLVLLATLVTAAVGYLISRQEEAIESHPRLVALAFGATAVLLILSRFASGGRSYASLALGCGLLIGLAQGVGAVAGISRSGITITACLLCGLERRRAGELSFLIAIPAVLGAAILKLPEAGHLLERVRPEALAAGMLVAFAAGLLSLKLLLWLVRRGSLYTFSFYLLPLAVVTFLLL